MNKTRQNIIYLEEDWGFFYGFFHNNKKHKHYAIQLSIPIENTITIETSTQSFEQSEALLIQSNVEHLISSSTPQLLCLFSPISAFGQKIIVRDPISNFSTPSISTLKHHIRQFAQDRMALNDLKQVIKSTFHNLHTSISINKQFVDQRIINALTYLKDNNNRIVPLSEIARYCHLSESRFIHLFKEQLGITYRRSQLWNKISASFPYLQNHSITETAYTFGFTDSAHYSRIFKENFGFSPKQLLKFSQFIQV